MKTYHKFILTVFSKSFIYVFFIMFSLVFILNILSELEFFRNIDVGLYLPIYISILNSPALIFEMFPFIFLISTQLFFINLFNDNQIQIFKYSGLKNSKILTIIAMYSLVLGLIIITLFYNFSSNLKNLYFELKNNYSADDKYLAVITKNGLWIKDKIGKSNVIINSSKIENEFLIDNFITEFNENYEVERNIRSDKINISNNDWIVFNPVIFKKNYYSQNVDQKELIFKTNFNYKKIQSLFSNLSSLSILELLNLRNNYLNLSYSTIEIDLHLLRLFNYPIYLVLMTIFSSIIMLKIKWIENTTFKISLGLFLSVVIYYINNFANILGKVEKIPLSLSVFVPIIVLTLINILMINRINEE